MSSLKYIKEWYLVYREAKVWKETCMKILPEKSDTENSNHCVKSIDRSLHLESKNNHKK